MAEALRITGDQRTETVTRVAALRDRLLDGLLDRVDGAVATAERSATVAGLAHLRMPGVESEALLVLLDQAGVAASAGASCASGAVEPSHVLLSMGLTREEAASGIRFSLGHATTAEEIDLALAAVPEAVSQLRN
jgi:cysteine desulfurase